MADELKQKGNEAMKAGEFDAAVKLYGEAIELDPSNHVLYSNRCAAYMKLERYDDALADAEKTIESKKDWAKGYSRKGSALFKLNRLEEAEETYKEGLKIDPNNASLKEGLEEISSRQDASDKSVPNPFQGPAVEAKLRAHPKTSGYMQDPDFLRKLQSLQLNPNTLMQHMQDPRVMDALGVLLGLDIKTMSPGGAGGPSDPFIHSEGKGPSSSDLTGEDSDDESSTKSSKSKSKTEPMEAEPSPDDQLSPEEREKKKKALEEKEKGNAAYKKKDFSTAIAHYDKAIELDPTDITFLTNKAAVFYEQGEWEECIKLCEEAVEKGREIRADYKLVAKALARIGNAYSKQEKLDKAITYYDKSLTEHRNQDVVKKRVEAEKKRKELERRAYLDEGKSLEEKEKGNKFFKEGNFPEAIRCYTEAIKRNPDDPKIFSNRAACYQKLLEFPLALKDCEECIRLDPKFVKGHIRKGHALLGVKDTVKALQAFQAAVDIDPSNAEARDGVSRCMNQDDPEARRKAAMHDPEVQKIFNDPAMQLILQQMQTNPEALRDHLKNPEIASKIQKLIEAGFISLR